MSQGHLSPALSPSSALASQECRDSIAYLEKVGGQEKPTKWQDHWRWEMANAHICFINLWRNVYLFAPYAVEHDDLANYLGYAEVTLFQIYNHHSFEEEYIFPEMMKAAGENNMETNIEQHHEFEPQLQAFWVYVRRCRSALNPPPPPSPVPEPPANVAKEDPVKLGLDPTKPFDAVAFQQAMDKIMRPLLRHLAAELDTIGFEWCDKVGKPALDKINADTQKHLQAYDPTWFLCSAFGSHDITVLKQLIPLPYLLRRLMVPFYFAPKHWGFWKYLPRVENLTFAGTA